MLPSFTVGTIVFKECQHLPLASPTRILLKT